MNLEKSKIYRYMQYFQKKNGNGTRCLSRIAVPTLALGIASTFTSAHEDDVEMAKSGNYSSAPKKSRLSGRFSEKSEITSIGSPSSPSVGSSTQKRYRVRSPEAMHRENFTDTCSTTQKLIFLFLFVLYFVFYDKRTQLIRKLLNSLNETWTTYVKFHKLYYKTREEYYNANRRAVR